MKTFAQLEAHFKQIHVTLSILSLLYWDQETMMPPGGAELRGHQLAHLQGHLHALQTAPAYLEGLKTLDGDSSLTLVQQASVRWQLRESLRASQTPARVLEELARLRVHARASWMAARSAGEFSLFSKHLIELLNLKKEIASHHQKPGQSLYEAVLFDYEPDFSLSRIEQLFAELKSHLVPLAEQICSGLQTRSTRLEMAMPEAEQKHLNLLVLEKIGFDLQQGRLDKSVHPFCAGSDGDVRLTTRFRLSDWTDSLSSVMHEAGHGMYNQVMGEMQPDTALAYAPSFGMHESQSRFWENVVGRSHSFLDYLLEQMRLDSRLAPYARLSAQTLYHHLNQPKFSYIRVEADEATYNLHILIRFELEKALFAGDLSVSDLPHAWNEKVHSYLHLPEPSLAQGVLQDSHWSGAAFGYFPSYTIGNLIAAQLLAEMRKDFDLGELVAQGEFKPVRDWLATHLQSEGRLQTTPEIVARVTNKELGAQAFIDYLKQKFRA